MAIGAYVDMVLRRAAAETILGGQSVTALHGERLEGLSRQIETLFRWLQDREGGAARPIWRRLFGQSR